MLRVATFFAGLAAALALLMWVVWRVDPLGDTYDGSATARALAAGHPCLISDDVVGVDSWWDFKRDLFRRRRPRVVVVGTSRVLQIRAHPDEMRFVNLGLPGTAPAMLTRFFRDLHRIRAAPLTVYLGVEVFWLNDNWIAPYPYVGPGRKLSLRDLINRQRLGATISRIAERPAVLIHRWETAKVGGRCVIDSAGRAEQAKVQAWWPDGSLSYPWELRPDVPRPEPADDFDRDLGNLAGPQYKGAYYGNWHRLDHLPELAQALALARQYRWRVVGFVPPYSTRYVRRLSTAPETAPRWREVARALPALFRRYGDAYVDTRWARTLGCSDHSFSDDGWHPDATCSAKLRRVLDAAAER